MRELKFRAWDKFNSEYIEIDDLYWFEENSVHDNNDAQYEIEQFTGLLDKNGKMIYENDLLQRPDNTGRIGLVQFSHGIFGLNWDWKESLDPCHDGIILGGWGNRTNLRPMYDDLIDTLQIVGTIHGAEYKELAK